MLKSLLTTVSLICSMAMAAQETDYAFVGLCDGQIATGQTGAITGKQGVGSVECAVRIPAAAFATLPNARITGINVGFPQGEVPEEITVWVREELNGENLTQGTLSGPAEGWNLVSLSSPMDIPAAYLYVGFSYEQQTRLNCISLAGPSTDPEGSWTRLNGGPWQSFERAAAGNLAIEAALSGDGVAPVDLAVETLTTGSECWTQDEVITLSGTVANRGVNSVDGFYIRWSAGGSEPVLVKFDTPVGSRQKSEFSLTFNAADVPARDLVTITATALLPDGQEDEVTDGNSAATDIRLFNRGFERTVLYEEFGTEGCINCPAAAEAVKEMISREGLEDKVVWVGHHTGYHEDSFTIPCSYAYEWFYPENLKYAPASMVDRTRFEWSDGGAVIMNTQSGNVLRSLNAVMERPAFARVRALAEYTGEGGLKVTAATRRLGLENTARLTVYVVETDVPAIAQSGYPGYIHEPMVRHCFTENWGETVEWDNDMATLTFTLESVPQEWKKENLYIVAFLSNYNPEDKFDCRVSNAVKVYPVAEGSATLEEEEDDDIYRKYQGGSDSLEMLPASREIVSVRYFDLTGMEVSSARKGFLIRTVLYSDGTCESTKIVN